MTYLLDVNVIQERRPGGHRNVLAWFSAVRDDELYLSTMTLREIEQGIAKARKTNPEGAERRSAVLAGIRAGYAGRILPIDDDIASDWGRMVGEKDKNRDDLALAATARIRGLILVTRNVKDFRGREVRVLDPFKANPVAVLV